MLNLSRSSYQWISILANFNFMISFLLFNMSGWVSASYWFCSHGIWRQFVFLKVRSLSLYMYVSVCVCVFVLLYELFNWSIIIQLKRYIWFIFISYSYLLREFSIMLCVKKSQINRKGIYNICIIFTLYINFGFNFE